MGVKLMYIFVLSNIKKQFICTKNCLSSLDVSEMYILGVSSMYIHITHSLNFLLSCSIKPRLQLLLVVYLKKR